jgi:hypothetical protein
MYDSTQPTKDEKQIKDFMVAKYEKKMYYSDPVSQKLNNGIQAKSTVTTPIITAAYEVNINYIFIIKNSIITQLLWFTYICYNISFYFIHFRNLLT